jgi:hypothetical protein
MSKEQWNCEQKLDLYQGLTWIFGMIIVGGILVNIWNRYELAPIPPEPDHVLKFCVNDAAEKTIELRVKCGKINDRNEMCLRDQPDKNLFVPACLDEFNKATKAYNSYHWWANIRGKE